jgi:hypothetical protein
MKSVVNIYYKPSHMQVVQTYNVVVTSEPINVWQYSFEMYAALLHDVKHEVYKLRV